MNIEEITERLKEIEKSVFVKQRMPTIHDISKLLTHYNIDHTLSRSVNVVEHRTKRRNYVNSRYNGKEGWELKADGLHLDTSDSYYSTNKWYHAKSILEIINSKK